jgi:hypothetical protein
MKELLILIIISGLSFLTFLVTLILGLTRKNKKLKLTALLLFMVFIDLAGWTGYKLVSKTYNKVADTFKMRTGNEIYDALFRLNLTAQKYLLGIFLTEKIEIKKKTVSLNMFIENRHLALKSH